MRRSLFALFSLTALTAAAQQVPDTAFTFRPAVPAYERNGPVVMVDEAHHDFHRIDGRYAAFAKVLRNDGYTVVPGSAPFTAAHLAQAKVLVIANALGDDGPWILPTTPAFSAEEIAAVDTWVRSGGSLLLIADHMPFGGAAAALAQAFGVNWTNGFALRVDNGPERFSRANGDLLATPVTDGRAPGERIDSILLFTGSAFIGPPEATPITRLDDAYRILLPQRAWVFNDSTASLSARHFTNGLLLEHGQGRVVCFGEAACFSAQLAGPEQMPFGMSSPGAEQNAQLLLNIMHWLDRRR